MKRFISIAAALLAACTNATTSSGSSGQSPSCGAGTHLANGQCVLDDHSSPAPVPDALGIIPVADGDNPSEDTAWTVAEIQGFIRAQGAVPVTIRTVLKGQTLVDLPIFLTGSVDSPMTGNSTKPYFRGKTDSAAGIWRKLSDIVEGMSGSTVLYQGRIVGSLSFSYGGTSYDGSIPCIVTPFQWMREADDFVGQTSAYNPDTFSYYYGMAALYLSPVAQEFISHNAQFQHLRGSQLASSSALNGGPLGGGISSAPDVTFSTALRPGSAVAMNFASGPLVKAGAVCTVTSISATGKIRACGHPITAVGNGIAVPYGAAWVNDVIVGPYGVFKDAAPVGPTLGAITADWYTEIVGTPGAATSAIHVLTQIYRSDRPADPTTSYQHEVAWGPGVDAAFYAALAGAYAPIAVAANSDTLGKATLDLDVAFKDTTVPAHFHVPVNPYYTLANDVAMEVYFDLLTAINGSGNGATHVPVQVNVKIAWQPQ